MVAENSLNGTRKWQRCAPKVIHKETRSQDAQTCITETLTQLTTGGLVSSPWALEIRGHVKPVEPVPSFGMGRIIAVRGLPRQGSSRGRLTPTLTESTPDIKACG